MLKKLNICVALVAVLGFAACGDDDKPAKNNTNNNTTKTTPTKTTPTTGKTTPTTGKTTPSNGTTTPGGNTTVPMGEQCDARGEVCEDGKTTKAGFVCVEKVCQNACTDPSMIPDGGQYPCPSGQLCLGATSGPFACIPSECTGILDTTSCEATEFCSTLTHTIKDAGDNELSSTGKLCSPLNAAAADVGGNCVSQNDQGQNIRDPSKCKATLTCDRTGTCQQACGNDAACTENGESCVGEDGNAVEQGVGFCAIKCTPYKSAEADSGCAAGTGCFPVSSTEGQCQAVTGTQGAFEACVTTSMAAEDQCGPNLACVPIQEGGTGIVELARCLPWCDGSLNSETAKSATCEGTPNSHCFGDSPTSVCTETCQAADYGPNPPTSSCKGTDNVCTPLNGFHACFPAAEEAVLKGIGETGCDTRDRTKGCKEGLVCVPGALGITKCVSYCEPNAATPPNDTLTCADSETCTSIGDAAFNFGVCGTTCTPTDYGDVACEANLKSCTLLKAGDTQGVCSASGSVALAGACKLTEAKTCLPELTCINSYNQSLSGGQAAFEMPGKCTQQCDLFNPTDSHCAATETCVPNITTEGARVGFCLEKEIPAQGQACTPGKACGDGASCIGFSDGPGCATWCDLKKKENGDFRGCAAGSTCRAIFTSNRVKFGICQ